MAVEDGAILGSLLDRLQQKGIPAQPEQKYETLTNVMKLYEEMRKKRTEVNVHGAVLTRQFYHLEDGDGQMKRDHELSLMPATQWQGRSKWNWADASYQKSLLGFNVLADAETRFDEWSHGGEGGIIQSNL
jgi:salicylate hydroxylase